MANPIGTACTSVIYKQPNTSNTLLQHAARFTAIAPAGSSVFYVPVGQLAGDDLVVIEQMGNESGLQLKPAASLHVHDSNAGYAQFITEDNANLAFNLPFGFTILRNA